ncbi:hypothetical protein ACPPVS_18815 [Cellulomonas sp. McL0617]|uniref:hypothetical protein n=1 Tax=Cellulomonas sp. McL0617 TaxID=3415675 RepID=UPI003CFB23C5
MAKTSLLTVARRELLRATYADSGRSTSVLFDVDDVDVRQSVLAMRAGTALLGYELGVAGWTIQVLQGCLHLYLGRLVTVGYPGDLLSGSLDGLRLVADENCVVLVTTSRGLISPPAG